MKETKSSVTFLQKYERDIMPSIAAIDVYLKSAEQPMDLHCVADLLSICETEVMRIMKNAGITQINKINFLHIMANGSSELCGFFKREMELSSPYTYTSEDLAHIYNLDHETVNNAYQKLQIKEATSFTMPLVFENILMHR